LLRCEALARVSAVMAWPAVFVVGVADGLRVFALAVWAEFRPMPDL
jgi:hypothetical protein